MADLRRWYHIIMSTYGSWLYGDARGFRTRHHREHILAHGSQGAWIWKWNDPS
jgi:hypothetical protein